MLFKLNMLCKITLKFQASFCCMYVHLLYTGEIPDGPVTVFGSFAVEGPKRYNL